MTEPLVRLDFLATQSHYAAHLEPIVVALGAKGVEVRCSTGDVPLADDGTPTVIAGFGDLALVPESRPVAMLDHGVGQTYRDVPHGAYNGGQGRGRVALFLYAGPLGAAVNEAAYPDAEHVVIGPAKLDQFFLGGVLDGTRTRRRRGAPVTIAFTNHWDLGIVPETRSAWSYYEPALRRLVAAGEYEFVGHCHPRDVERMEGVYASMGVPFVRDADEVLWNCDVLAADNTSLLWEAAAVGIPVLALDAPFYRDQPRQPPRFYDAVPGLRLRAYRSQASECGVVYAQWGRDNLAGAVAEALDDRVELRDLRRVVVGRVYTGLDGRAAERGADALVAWAAKV